MVIAQGQGSKSCFGTVPFGTTNIHPMVDSMNLGKVWAFNVLQIISFVLNVLIFSTAMLSSRVKRAPIWFMFMGGWILWAVAYALLLLSGRQIEDNPPPQALCLFQAGLVYAFPPYMVFLNLGLVAHVYLVIRATIEHLRPRTQTPLIFILLPIGVFLGPLIEVLVIGVRNPAVIQRKKMLYCNATDRISFKISAVLCALGALSTAGLEVALGIKLYTNWQAYQVIRHLPGNATIVFRLFVFGIAPALALVANIIAEIYPKFGYLSIIMLHSLPTIAALIFGTHKVSRWSMLRYPSIPTPPLI
ncbi:hypothetical protein L218DRAFT_998565 [Marasmius fiardii PR-910]|nr:hypothetical protein L218DRAFT_998565 [Marasmius fiardii PR-910]